MRRRDRRTLDNSSFACALLVSGLTWLSAACQSSSPSDTPEISDSFCSIPEAEIFNGGVGKDGIRALVDPVMADAGTEEGDWPDSQDRVIGLVIDGQAFAVPHQALWLHEIVNLRYGASSVAVTYCPLTGSSLVFDRTAIGDAELGVSGLLFRNNLIMYDRRTEESLWPQMLRGARCGASDGAELPMVPALDMTWEGWTSLYPETKVLAQDPESGRNFESYPYPYGDYEALYNSELLFPMPPIDTRRPPKERVLGVPSQRQPREGGIAFPFGELNTLGSTSVSSGILDGRSIVVFWDGLAQGAAAFYPQVGTQELTFETMDGTFTDVQTGSIWRMDGLASAGELAGERLEPVREAYVAFWFAWAAFHPATQLWGAEI